MIQIYLQSDLFYRFFFCCRDRVINFAFKVNVCIYEQIIDRYLSLDLLIEKIVFISFLLKEQNDSTDVRNIVTSEVKCLVLCIAMKIMFNETYLENPDSFHLIIFILLILIGLRTLRCNYTSKNIISIG